MIGLFAATIISCSDVLQIANRLSRVVGLSYLQKIEILKTITEYVPSCPIIIQNDGKFRPK